MSKPLLPQSMPGERRLVLSAYSFSSWNDEEPHVHGVIHPASVEIWRKSDPDAYAKIVAAILTGDLILLPDTPSPPIL